MYVLESLDGKEHTLLHYFIYSIYQMYSICFTTVESQNAALIHKCDILYQKIMLYLDHFLRHKW